MLFNSLDFLFFFPTVVLLYFATPHRFRWALLLTASYYFYACWKLEYVVLIAVSTLIDYGVGIALERASSQSRRRLLLGLSIAGNLGILFAFKYFNFFSNAVQMVFSAFDVGFRAPALHVLLPVGISFYTFQSLSYSIDVYRGRRPAERHLGIFALYVSFFPQLVAGPIERSTSLLPQFHQKKRFDANDVREGVYLILWGLFKKVVIADRVAGFVRPVYGNPGAFDSLQILIASYLFAFQLYCDFSGYSDIALGAGKVMGFDLTLNFRRPFAARTLREFWQRWHISLTRWMIDYLYLPLAKRASSPRHKAAAVCVVFIVVGLWHGAAWNFVLFGACVGLAVVFGDVTRRHRKKLTSALFPRKSRSLVKLHHALQILAIFHLYVAGSILFRVKSVSDLVEILRKLAGGLHLGGAPVLLPGVSLYEMLLGVFFIIVLETVQWLQEHKDILGKTVRSSVPLQWVAAYALVFAILMFGEFNLTPFIYFQF